VYPVSPEPADVLRGPGARHIKGRAIYASGGAYLGGSAWHARDFRSAWRINGLGRPGF